MSSILIVEDDSEAIEAFALILKGEGYAVRTARDAPSALAELAREAPSAIVLDLQLPVGSGLEVLRQLRTMPGLADVPVAVVTGNYMLDEGAARELKTLGATLYFKPVWGEDLIRIVRTLVRDIAS